jgi:two-component system LytT family response regulator
MIRTVIIDDEKKAITNLSLLVNRYCSNLEIVGTATSISDGLVLIEDSKPDLVFLDIEMPFGTGFDLLSQIEDIKFQVIFVTAYNQYAIQAIKCNALDYILKPIDIDELKSAVDGVSISGGSDERLKALLSGVTGLNRRAKIALANDGSYTMVPIDSIIRCEAAVNYTVFHIENCKSITVTRTLKQFEEILPADKFIRVHQSNLVNLDKIEKYYKTDGSYLLMSDSSTVPVSRRKKEEVEMLLLK